MRLRPVFTGLSWFGGRKPEREGGLVASIGLNQRSRALAVDPEGTMPAPKPGRTLPSGPQLSVEALSSERSISEIDARTLPSGRIRLPR